jgi:hypothetical protein
LVGQTLGITMNHPTNYNPTTKLLYLIVVCLQPPQPVANNPDLQVAQRTDHLICTIIFLGQYKTCTFVVRLFATIPT